jgi:hypothetical protein
MQRSSRPIMPAATDDPSERISTELKGSLARRRSSRKAAFQGRRPIRMDHRGPCRGALGSSFSANQERRRQGAAPHSEAVCCWSRRTRYVTQSTSPASMTTVRSGKTNHHVRRIDEEFSAVFSASSPPRSPCSAAREEPPCQLVALLARRLEAGPRLFDGRLARWRAGARCPRPCRRSRRSPDTRRRPMGSAPAASAARRRDDLEGLVGGRGWRPLRLRTGRPCTRAEDG